MRLDKTQKYIAAVSGGPDSMAMLNKFKKFITVVAHVNYHKRADSSYDTKLVKEFCVEHDIKLEILDVTEKIYKKSQQHNFQALARIIRYDFFNDVAKKYKCCNLLVAHNLNDFLETAVMQQNRKSLNFFYGIKEVSQYKNLKIYRPLINSWKSDLEKYCNKNDIKYAIDSTNSSDIYERNRIRKQIRTLSVVEQKKLLKKIKSRNNEMAKIKKEIFNIFNQWKAVNYSISYIKKSGFPVENVKKLIYIFLKENNIENINHNKIILVTNFVFSTKPNQKLRLQNNIFLIKKNKKVSVQKIS